MVLVLKIFSGSRSGWFNYFDNEVLKGKCGSCKAVDLIRKKKVVVSVVLVG